MTSALFILFLLSFANAFACDCTAQSGYNSPQKALALAERVYMGTAVDTAEVKVGTEKIQRTNFRVEVRWKGVDAPKDQVDNEINNCRVQFVPGKRYLVFSSRDRKKNDLCNGTRPIEKADQTMKALGKPLLK